MAWITTLWHPLRDQRTTLRIVTRKVTVRSDPWANPIPILPTMMACIVSSEIGASTGKRRAKTETNSLKGHVSFISIASRKSTITRALWTFKYIWSTRGQVVQALQSRKLATEKAIRHRDKFLGKQLVRASIFLSSRKPSQVLIKIHSIDSWRGNSLFGIQECSKLRRDRDRARRPRRRRTQRLCKRHRELRSNSICWRCRKSTILQYRNYRQVRKVWALRAPTHRVNERKQSSCQNIYGTRQSILSLFWKEIWEVRVRDWPQLMVWFHRLEVVKYSNKI